ncbi:50S ribosomal protein L17 [Candidatus Gracilibacteria bacterium]|nr:50S ribosomal protein L17 [Candidatus Gracilibacteria bacterium]
MRHRNTKATLNRPVDQRKALIRSLITALFLSGKVKTTDAKARALVSEVEKLITRVRGKESMNAIRDLKKIIYTEASSKKALEYTQKTNKNSGFTRITKVGHRAGDNALMMQVELISE